jgi:hypothetical protein
VPQSLIHIIGTNCRHNAHFFGLNWDRFLLHGVGMVGHATSIKTRSGSRLWPDSTPWCQSTLHYWVFHFPVTASHEASAGATRPEDPNKAFNFSGRNRASRLVRLPGRSLDADSSQVSMIVLLLDAEKQGCNSTDTTGRWISQMNTFLKPKNTLAVPTSRKQLGP